MPVSFVDCLDQWGEPVAMSIVLLALLSMDAILAFCLRRQAVVTAIVGVGLLVLVLLAFVWPMYTQALDMSGADGVVFEEPRS